MKTISLLASLIITSVVSFSAQAAIQVGDKAPEVILATLNAGPEAATAINLAPEKDQKVVIEFFSTTCIYCMRNLVNVRAFQTEYTGKVVFRMIGIDRQEQMTRDFAAENLDLIVAVDNARVAKKAYNITATPTTIIIGSDNTILFIGEGQWDAAEQQAIRDVLNQ